MFQGKGEHFCYGASVPEHRREHVAEMLTGLHDLLRSIIDLSKPGLALIRGCCLGGKLELAVFCQWIFAAEGARCGQPEIAPGVFPPTATLILPWRVGQPAADDLILTGRTISAAEAKQLGWCIRSLLNQKRKWKSSCKLISCPRVQPLLVWPFELHASPCTGPSSRTSRRWKKCTSRT